MKKYKINDIFYSLQGEGRWAGKAAIFIRFAGCNLKCPFCDTDFKQFKEMSEIEILEKIQSLSDFCKFVVFTGGEPTLQLDESLTTLLQKWGYYIAIETNGTHKIPGGVNWVTCSPKCAFTEKAEPVIKVATELKVVFDGEHEISDFGIDADYFYVQPCDTGDKTKNTGILKQTIAFVEANPKWQLSLQQQKIIDVK